MGFTPARVIALLEDAPPPREQTPSADLARELVERIANGIGVECRVDVREDEETVHVTCSGDDLGLLIGKHGQTIDAIQYLANAILYRLGDERKDVVVDAAGYRARRRATLEALAVRTAQEALRIGGPVELEPMTAVERKIVHVRLQDFTGVATESSGLEPNRYVVVRPLD